MEDAPGRTLAVHVLICAGPAIVNCWMGIGIIMIDPNRFLYDPLRLRSIVKRPMLAWVNASAAEWRPDDPSAARALLEAHAHARAACATSRATTLPSGGWCLRRMARRQLFGHAERRVTLRDGTRFMLPDTHVEADSILVRVLLRRVLRASGGTLLSLLDLGSGVGQYGYALRALAPLLPYRAYDGAGDVEEYTRGFVRFADLRLRLALPRADWVLSLEVGEHLAAEHEAMYLRNLHAHNCRGIVLSWALHGGHQHVNRRPSAYVVGLVTPLGYRLNEKLTEAMRSPHARSQVRPEQQQPRGNMTVYGWFAHTVMVFERIQPLSGIGCT